MTKRSAVYTIFLSFIFIILSTSIILYGQSNLSKVIKEQTGANDRIKATFSYSPLVPVTDVPVRFICKTNFTPEAWLWEFGDGTISYDPSPAHAYNKAGVYNVTLTVAMNGHSARATKKVRVYAAKTTAIQTKTQELVASFEFSPATPEAGLNIQFTDQSTGSPTSWSWDFGDGSKSTVQNPQHQYINPGTFNVTLIVSNGTLTKSLTRTITVIAVLNPGFNFSPSNPESGEEIQFQDITSGNPTAWNWNFGDGSTSNLQNPTYSYNNAGLYNVTLQVSNGYYTKSISKNVTVLAPIVVDFSYNPAAPVAGQDVQFVNNSTGSITNYSWNFGDGYTSSLKDPVHKFNSAGTYTVTLTSSNSRDSKSKSKTITVSQSLNPSFTYTPASPYTGQSVQFTDTSSGSPTSWQWNFGDGSTSNLKNPSHTYSTAGNYTATLTVSNSAETKTTSKTITVKPVVQADFTYNPTNPVVGTAIQFTDKSSGNITSWFWQFGDGGTSTLKNPTKAYSAAGSYNVKLTVSDGATSNSMTQTITIAAAIVADFTYNPSSPIVGQEVQFLDNSQGSPTSWSWDFGDGESSTVKNPIHTYRQSGSYTVRLTVSNGTSSSSQSKSLTISSLSRRTITAASCSLADVQAAIMQANDGDMVIVPNGEARWTQQLIINKGIILKAATKGGTTIYADYQAPNNYAFDRTSWLIIYEPKYPESDPIFRLSGFNIISTGSSTQIFCLRNDQVLYPLRKIRIDNNYFKSNTITGRRVLGIIGAVYGVADNNVFEDGSITSYGANADTWYNLKYNYGTEDNFYLEDNQMNITLGSPAGGAGGRYAFRNNIWRYSGTSGLYPWFDAHGNQGAGQNHATMGVEIYNETMYFNMPSGYGLDIFDIRGGKALVYNLNVIFQNSGTPTAQIREEVSDYENPPATNPAGQPQHPSDCYFFLLRKNGTIQVNVKATQQVYYDGKGYVPTEDKEFWQEKSNFTGSSGIGVGPLSARPATCTKEGVAWWATDENKLYRWKNGRWELYYTPYTYPHPLRTILSD